MTFPISEDGAEIIQYDYAAFPAYSAKGYISSCPDYRYPSHWHDAIEMSYIIRGEMQYLINGNLETVREGNGIFINSKQLHYNFSANHTECEYICILFHPMLLHSIHFIDETYVAPLLENPQLPYMKLTDTIPWQSEICKELQAIYAQRDLPEAPMLLLAHFLSIWAKLHHNIHSSHIDRKNSTNVQIIKKMMCYIMNHYREDITLEDIAVSGAVGQSKCCKLFQQYLGMTPNAYLNQCRLIQSQKLLRNTDLSVTEIAAEVGYSSASYYAESFRKWYGKSPTEYRKDGECDFRSDPS